MRKKIMTAVAVAGVGVVSFAGAADAGGKGRDGGCVAANLSALDGATKSAAARGIAGLPVSLPEAIQLHLDGDLDLSAFLGGPALCD